MFVINIINCALLHYLYPETPIQRHPVKTEIVPPSTYQAGLIH